MRIKKNSKEQLIRDIDYCIKKIRGASDEAMTTTESVELMNLLYNVKCEIRKLRKAKKNVDGLHDLKLSQQRDLNKGK